MLDFKKLVSMLSDEATKPLEKDYARAIEVIEYLEQRPYLHQLTLEDGFLQSEDLDILNKFTGYLSHEEVEENERLCDALEKLPHKKCCVFF